MRDTRFGLMHTFTFLTGTEYDKSSHTHHQQHPGYYYHHHCPWLNWLMRTHCMGRMGNLSGKLWNYVRPLLYSAFLKGLPFDLSLLVFILTGNSWWCWSVGSGSPCYCTCSHWYCCCCCCCWKRSCMIETYITLFSYLVQQEWDDLHSVCFSWLYSIQCHIGPVDCYWRLVWTYIVCDQIQVVVLC